MLELHDVSVRVGSATLLDHVSTTFEAGAFTAILGANGAGKSTLMRVAAGLRTPSSGTVTLDGEALAGQDPKRLARRRAILTQGIALAFPLAAEDVVMMGRYPHFARTPTPRDRAVVADALALVGMAPRARQLVHTLSGGERQRVHVARVLAQLWPDDTDGGASRWLLLDEPTTSLDLRATHELMALLRTLPGRGITVVMVVHDLTLATQVADRFVFLAGGRLAGTAASSAGVSADLVTRTFGVRAERIEAPDGGAPLWRVGLPGG
jgi:iron complex transport system ATP-binding protein